MTYTKLCFIVWSQVVIKDKVLELLLYFTKNEDEEVQTKAIIGLGMHQLFLVGNNGGFVDKALGC